MIEYEFDGVGWFLWSFNFGEVYLLIGEVEKVEIVIKDVIDSGLYVWWGVWVFFVLVKESLGKYENVD